MPGDVVISDYLRAIWNKSDHFVRAVIRHQSSAIFSSHQRETKREIHESTVPPGAENSVPVQHDKHISPFSKSNFVRIFCQICVILV